MIKNMCIISIVATVLAAVSCGNSRVVDSADSSGVDSSKTVVVPEFNADSAYAFVEKQCSFGARVPGTATHAATADWIEHKLNEYGADTVIVQRGTGIDAQGRKVPIRNIIAKYNAMATERLLLAAHYDTRPWADEDPDKSKHMTPIDGANDGASGVGVLLEISRQLSKQNPGFGVDILMTDAEDSGESAPDEADDATRARYDESWCLGTQYFARNLPYAPTQLPRQAILLDMVGGKDAVFPREYFSAQAAPAVVARISEVAASVGLQSRFPSTVGGAVNDDHLPLIAAGIPTADIIEIGHPQTGSFNPTWHTMADNMSNIDKSTLKAVGTVLLTIIYTNE